MKSIFTIFAVCVLGSVTQPTWAQSKPAPGTTAVRTNEITTVYVTPVCRLGVQFIIATQEKVSSGGASAGIALVQVMAPAAAGSSVPAQPMACKEEPKSANQKPQSQG